MSKLTVTCVVVFALLFITGLPNQVVADEICACYQKEHGQLRVVNNHSECLLSELPILLCGEEPSPPCPVPQLEGTAWSAKADNVSGPGFEFDIEFKIIFTEQHEHLFKALFELPWADLDVPLFGAIVDCNEIRISTGQTVLFAAIDPDGNKMTGYWFSTDPLHTVDGEWDLTRENPHMATFEAYKIQP